MIEYLAIDSGEWLEKLRWCLIEQICHGVKCKTLLAIMRIQYCAILDILFLDLHSQRFRNIPVRPLIIHFKLTF